MNLIANTGIQFLTVPLEISLNDNFRMYFHEWLDVQKKQLNLEVAHYFPEEEIWVKKKDLSRLGYLQIRDEEEEGKTLKKGDVLTPWNDIKDDFVDEGCKQINIETELERDSGCFNVNLNRCNWEKFEDKWLPFPMFSLSSNNRSEFGPTNWCRAKLVLESNSDNIRKYNLILAFDTRAIHNPEDEIVDELKEMPVFISENDKYNSYALCNDEFQILNFCSEKKKCSWVNEYILELFHGVQKIEELRLNKPKLNYLAQFNFIVNYIQRLNVIPTIKLYSDKNVAFGDVDLVLDIGNSRTRAVLFDDSDFTKVEALALQNFTSFVKDNKLNRNSDPFEMRLAFREENFGGDFIKGSTQFVYPSMVRLGDEANELIHLATNLNTNIEKITTFSSPKRFLWDDKIQDKEWEYVTLDNEASKSIWLDGVSQQLNSDGTLNTDGYGGVVSKYSRKALMTFSFLELFSQTQMQINSYEFRNKWGGESTPRRIGRVIVTCPTAMSRKEQVALRKCAEDASIMLNRFYNNTYYDEIDDSSIRKQVKVIPSSKNLENIEEPQDWIYDEATSSQFVYLYAELKERYLNNSKEFFDLYGSIRNDLNGSENKTVTIGSVDIGGGTTDLMIANYTHDEYQECKIKPTPLFWESFYTAGDDLLKKLIRQLIIEGKHAAIEKQLHENKVSNITQLTLDFFGKDNARQSILDRQIRSEFNLQVSVPVVSKYLELLNENKIDKVTLGYNDIFIETVPTDRVLNKFEKHFGFSLSSIKWVYDKGIVSKIVESTFNTLVNKIATVLSYYGCDIVLLTGRPTSLQPLSDLFLKYYAISPNRLIRLNNYRVGTWYPFHDGMGYFSDSKSIVAVGAMIANYASEGGGLNGFVLDLNDLRKKLLPTTDYFATAKSENAFITPTENNATINVSQIPSRLWTRQLNSTTYPTRKFYRLDFNIDRIRRRVIDRQDSNPSDKKLIEDGLKNELNRLLKRGPFKIQLIREEYPNDKETLTIDSVLDINDEEIPRTNFILQIQSMDEDEDYWLDSGEFINLSIENS